MLSNEDTLRKLAELGGNLGKAAIVLGSDAVKDVTNVVNDAYDAGLKQGKRNGCCIGCLIPIVGAILAVYILAAVASASEIPKEIVESNKSFSKENSETLGYAERLIASGIPVTKEQLDVASMLDDMSKSSVGAGKTPVIINPIKNR